MRFLSAPTKTISSCCSSLQASWSHQSHLLDRETYTDPGVIRQINAHFIPVRVDKDTNPDLANRYNQWGWPATIVFNPDGKEVFKRRGYLRPAAMASILRGAVRGRTDLNVGAPAHEMPPAPTAALSPAQRKSILSMRDRIYDREFGGWGQGAKSIDPDDFEYAITQAIAGNQHEAAEARQSLDVLLKLMDPVWGGLYDYALRYDWKFPEFEKLMQVQSQGMQLYALGYAAFHKPEYLDAARKIAQYLRKFLRSPQGAFYASQSADPDETTNRAVFFSMDARGRAIIGGPPVDQNLYARENGWAIQGLTALYDVTGEQQYLDEAVTAAKWVIKHRASPGGGFYHGPKPAQLYLADNLAMAQAFLALYQSSGNRAWLKRAADTTNFMRNQFSDPVAGYVAALRPSGAQSLTPASRLYRNIGENIALARFANRLFHFTGDPADRKMAESAMRYAASPELIKNRIYITGLVSADQELAKDPLHITVVGAKDDPDALQLYRAALSLPSTYERIEWWDKDEGPLPNPDVDYPATTQAAAFVCSGSTCSPPVFDPLKLAAAIGQTKPAPGQQASTAPLF